MYNLNTKVNWEQLAPSLQAKFNFKANILEQRKRILASNGNILNNNANAGYQLDKLTWLKNEFDNKIDKYLIEIDRKQLPDIESTTDDGGLDNSMFTNTFEGQVAKTKTNKEIFGSDFLYNLRVTTNQAEFDYMVNSAPFIDLQDVFNNWYRFAHSDNNALAQLVTNPREHGWGTYQSNMYHDHGFLDHWGYDSTKDCIYNGEMDSPFCGFINPKDCYTNYFIRIKYNTGDDDNAAIIVGYYMDSGGTEHTLSIVRGAHSDTICFWALIYDAGNPTQHKLVDYTSKVGSQGSGTFYISAKRLYNSFEFKCAPVNSSVDNEDWTIRWALPEKSYATSSLGYTDAEYENLRIMTHTTNRVGFAVRSMRCEFYVVEQYEVFEDNDIYRLDRDEIWTRGSGSSSYYNSGRKCSDVLQPYVYLYNSYLGTLYFYGSLPSSIDGSENGYDWMKITPGKLNYYSEGSGR